MYTRELVVASAQTDKSEIRANIIQVYNPFVKALNSVKPEIQVRNT
jgi:hypothetical protein